MIFQPELIQDELDEYRKLNVSYMDDDFHSGDYHNQEIAIEDDYSFCFLFKKCLPKWIASIHTIPCERIYNLLFSDQDKFLCFNYTDTLEKTYDIPNAQILYIHGKWTDNDLLIGHNTSEKFPEEGEDDLYEDIAGIRAFSTAQTSVYKDVKGLICENKTFFDGLSSIDSVYVLGHSMSDIDFEYFIEIKKHIRIGSKWFISYYNDDNGNCDLKIKQEKTRELNISDLDVIFATIEEILCSN